MAYDKRAVDRMISADKTIGAAEAKLIHRLLAGRTWPRLVAPPAKIPRRKRRRSP